MQSPRMSEARRETKRVKSRRLKKLERNTALHALHELAKPVKLSNPDLN